jgi:hypothetical protein
VTIACDDDQAIDVRDLRKMGLGEFWKDGREEVAPIFMKRAQQQPLVLPSTAADKPEFSARKGAGRKGLPIDHYKTVAYDYLIYLSLSNNPTSRIAAKYEVSQPTAARWVSRARKLGLLPETKPGRARPIADRDSED